MNPSARRLLVILSSWLLNAGLVLGFVLWTYGGEKPLGYDLIYRMGRALHVPALFVYFVAWFIFPSIFVLTGAFVGLLEKNRPFLIGIVATTPWVLLSLAEIIRNVLVHRTDRMGWKLVECFIYAGMSGVSSAAIAQVRKSGSLLKSRIPRRLKPSSN